VVIGGLFIVGLLAFSWPHIVIGTMTSRDKMIFKWMPLLVFVVGGFMFYTIPFVWGSILAPAIGQLDGTKVPVVSGQEADYVLQTIVTAYLPRWFSVFVLMGVIGAAVSTAAVQLMTAAILVSRDVIHSFLLPDADDRTLIFWTKVAVVGIVVLAMIVALWNPVALAEYLTHIAVPGFVQWAPCLLGGLLWTRGTRQGAVASVVAGTVLLIVGYFAGLGTKTVLIAVVVNAVVYVVVSLLTPKPSAEIRSRFFDEVDEFLSSKA
jgi:SSS family solute:Na+ symporter